MPTIDELDAALAVTDGDEIALSQAGIARKASRSQLVAGLQTQMAIASGQLLGRASAGTGGPEAITVGPNLTLAGGTLSATATSVPFTSLPAGRPPIAADLMATSQAGRNVTVNYLTLMAGIAGLPGLDGSVMTALAPGTITPRTLADIAGDALTVETFGARGDGNTDDSFAFTAALASGRPLRLGPKTYVVNGQFSILPANVSMFGVPGMTRLLRKTQTGGGAWILVLSASFRADGIIFDANRAAVSTDSWGVLVSPACTVSDISRCSFINAAGPVLGSGLVLQASDPAIVDHLVRECLFANNAAHGLWVQACAGVLVQACRARDNVQYGICVDYNDGSFRQKARLVEVLGCRAWNNARGISIGNFNATNAQPPIWGNANPDATSVLVAGNVCHNNTIYGIAGAGQWLAIVGNLTSANGSVGTSGAGILANVAHSQVRANTINGGALFGIDCGGSVSSDISGNLVEGAVFGINCGGSTALRVADNIVQDCTNWAIVANNVEADGNGQTFGIPCTALSITTNTIGMNGALASGVLLRDGPQTVTVARNTFNPSNGALIGNALWASTDSVIVRDNIWNGTPRLTTNPVALNGLQTLVFPDIADTVMVTTTSGPIQSILSSYQAVVAGRITFIRVTAGGTGYTRATVAIGGAGTGATASAVISNGSIIGVAVTAPGSGYGAAPGTAAVTISGDGTGALATAYVGLPLVDERRVRVRCNGPVVFARAASAPFQENAGQNDLTVPAFGDVDWVATFGQWRAVRATPTMLVGCIAATGHGTPEGVVAAPPGSDYRNLDGGAGATLWVKRTGTGPTGWFAVA